MEKKKFRVDRMTHRKAYFVVFIFIVMAIVLIFALFKMQIIDYDHYQSLVLGQLTTELEINPNRGEIRDSDGEILAEMVTK
ncbi:MAG: hypothetical protein IJQ80_01545, partial [Clostridia bacterium]|nr:hypothetical protein [Clostridia bacterium]